MCICPSEMSVLPTDPVFRRSFPTRILIQSWRRQVYLLQVPHLFIWHFTVFITGEPSINRLPVLLIEGKPSINAYFPLIFTCIGSLILPTSLKALGDIFVYSLPGFQSDTPEILEKETFSSTVYPIRDTSIDGDPSIKELW